MTLIAQSSDFLLLLAELVLCGGQGRHRCVLAGLSVGDGLVGLLLGQPSRRILVQLLGAGPLQVVHHLLRAGGQRLAGGRGRDHVVGAGRREVAVRRAVDVTGHRETVKSLLGGRDCGVGVFDRLLAGLDVVLCGGRVVARGLDVNHRLVDAFFLGLDLRVEILQTLIGLCHVGDQFGQQYVMLLPLFFVSVGLADAIFVRDGDVYTSAGISSGIDLALALVEIDHGVELVRSVARWLVVYLKRAGGQSQFSVLVESAVPPQSPLRKVTDAISAAPAANHSVTRLASLASVSTRQLTRLFQSELGTTPARYVEMVRVDAARAALDAGHSVADTARVAGFGSPESLRRVFVDHLGVSPKAYRERFRTASRG